MCMTEHHSHPSHLHECVFANCVLNRTMTGLMQQHFIVYLNMRWEGDPYLHEQLTE